jgi:hypothetical protein
VPFPQEQPTFVMLGTYWHMAIAALSSGGLAAHAFASAYDGIRAKGAKSPTPFWKATSYLRRH